MKNKKRMHFSVRIKLMLSYFAMIFLPVLILNAVVYNIVSDVLENQVKFSANQAFDQARTFLEYKISTVDNISEDTLPVILDNAKTTPHSLIMLINSGGEIISGTDAKYGAKLLSGQGAAESLLGGPVSWQPMTFDSVQFIVTASAIRDTGWTMVSLVPYGDITAHSAAFRSIMIILGSVIVAVSYITAYFISTRSVKRILRLADKMRRVQDGELIEIEGISSDEIGEVQNAFNYMVKRIRLLMDEQYQTGVEKKNLDLLALQTQINPHFLYNTLDLIGWKAIEYGASDISMLVKALARFYKLSLNRGQDLITIRDEINHAAVYTQIQNMRFANRIKLIVDVDERLYSQKVPKIILQPLIENSILHGILRKSGETEESIIISSRMEEDRAVLLIRDYGVGMSGEKMAELLQFDGSDSSQGYGVYNIDRRLKLCFGEQYGLFFRLPPGGGVMVEMHIPLQDA